MTFLALSWGIGALTKEWLYLKVGDIRSSLEIA